jgi:hypothetical protein
VDGVSAREKRSKRIGTHVVRVLGDFDSGGFVGNGHVTAHNDGAAGVTRRAYDAAVCGLRLAAKEHAGSQKQRAAQNARAPKHEGSHKVLLIN